MKSIQYSASPGVPHRSMEEEFLCHRRASEWWYCTGFMNDESGRLLSFQFTLARIRLSGVQMHILMTALTDFESRVHHYAQKPVFFARNVVITRAKVGLRGTAGMEFRDREIDLRMNGGDYTLALVMKVTKPPVWHCDDGEEVMLFSFPQDDYRDGT